MHARNALIGSWIFLCACMALAPTGARAEQTPQSPAPIAQLALHHEPGANQFVPNAAPVFGQYLGSGDGTATGVLGGRIVWDLYEDQTQSNAHPAFFRGVIEHNGASYPFEIIGALTSETPRAPVERQRWSLSGVIVFDGDAPMGARQALVAGETVLHATEGWRHSLTVWRAP